MEQKINFIKIFDEEIATTLCNSGFSYIQEKVNDNQAVYVFEKSPELTDLLGTLFSDERYSQAIYVEDGRLNF